ncbi:MAG: uncharacterized protein A8A55_0386 [Amphiamblys sp. WSBS2006]|nr:MAG: uncharacterized protein A8A55_0386 [Amphiamblys sp. WSBS2006]
MKSSFTVQGMKEAAKETRSKDPEKKTHTDNKEEFETKTHDIKQETLESVERSLKVLDRSQTQTEETLASVADQKEKLEEYKEVQENTKQNLGKMRSKIRSIYKYSGWIPFTFKYWRKGKEVKKSETEIQYDQEKKETPIPEIKPREESPVDKKYEASTEKRIEKGIGEMSSRAETLKETAKRLQGEIDSQQTLLEIVEEKQADNEEKLKKHHKSLSKL